MFYVPFAVSRCTGRNIGLLASTRASRGSTRDGTIDIVVDFAVVDIPGQLQGGQIFGTGFAVFCTDGRPSSSGCRCLLDIEAWRDNIAPDGGGRNDWLEAAETLHTVSIHPRPGLQTVQTNTQILIVTIAILLLHPILGDRLHQKKGSFGVDSVVVSGFPPKGPPLVVIVTLAVID